VNRTDLQDLADIRIEEAQALLGLTPPRPDAAYHLAGYSVECALKAIIAGFNQQHDWPEKEFVNKCHTHNLQSLMIHARLDKDCAAEVASNPVFEKYWTLVKDWNEHVRYDRHPLAKAQQLITAITDPSNGVLPWIKARW
jgi:hypothetical protein